MEHTQLALSAVMIVAVGLIGTNFVTGLETTGQDKFDALSTSNTVFGHITMIHSDNDGNILSYLQTDNIVAAIGKDCMSNLVFGNTDTNCTAVSGSFFNTIALFDNESFPITMNATDLSAIAINNTGASGLGIIVADTVFNNANATSGGVGTKTDIKKTFTAGPSVSQPVDGAALFNDDEDAVLAGQTFTQVTLNESDTLAITWTITVG